MADRRRRRTRASQDSEESGSDSTGSGSEKECSRPRAAVAIVPAVPEIIPVCGPRAEGESECESEDGIEGDAVLSDYESAGESEGENEGEYSEEEEPVKVILKRESHATEEPTSKAKELPEKAEKKDAIADERQSGDGQESTETDENKAAKKSQKLDDDEDRKNPAYIPRKGLFFEHDLRGQIQEEEVRPKGRQRKLWKDEGRWEHDKFREDEQVPKSRDELITMYGYDIRCTRNPDDIRPRRMRKPRFESPPRREQGWSEEKPERLPLRYPGPNNTQPPERTFNHRFSSGRIPPSRSFPRTNSYKENRPNYRPFENEQERSKPEYNYYRARSCEYRPDREPSPEPVVSQTEKGSLVKAEETVLENSNPAAETVPITPPQDKPVEKKSYSRVRRTRVKGSETGKSPEEPALAPPPVEVVASPAEVKTDTWEAPVESNLGELEQDLSQLNVAEQVWTPEQPQYLQPRELQGIPNHIHMGGGPPQFNRMEELGVQSGRVKRYSSQRQRSVPEPAPMHISIMERHYYDPLQFQGPIYAHSESQPPLPPQGMIVQPEMHLPHPGLHPHQPAAPLTNPGLYPPSVPLPPGQPPPQQLLPPPYFSPPGVMNYGTPSYPYAPGALQGPPPPPPPHLYPNPQAQSQVYGGVTYYNTVHQQVQPKLSPPRRTSHPVTVKPPPPEGTLKEKNST
ncbi:protein CASC3 [Ambystoma mexicanum]|uniref:protein CASC3 n=1 Tax=Ambystoma mexicanum TaxID=8296 RepID=UPI0037E917D2